MCPAGLMAGGRERREPDVLGGQAFAETVHAVHRGVAGAEGVVTIVSRRDTGHAAAVRHP